MEERKRSHHAVISSRPYRVEIMLSVEEMELLNKRIEIVSENRTITRSEFIRNMALRGEIVNLSAEERIGIARLKNVGTNLWQLRKKLHDEGMLNYEIKIKNLISDFEEIFAFFQNKLMK